MGYQIAPNKSPQVILASPIFRNTILFELAISSEEYKDACKIYENNKDNILINKSLVKFTTVNKDLSCAYAMSNSQAHPHVTKLRKNTDWYYRDITRKDEKEVDELIASLNEAKKYIKDEKAQPFLDKIDKRLTWEKQFFQKKWVNLTFDPNFSNWKFKNGDFEYIDSNTIIATDYENKRPHYIFPQIFIPYPYELEVDIEVISEKATSPVRPGIIVGNMFGDKTGYAFYTIKNKIGILTPKTNKPFDINIPSNKKNTLRVKIFANRIEAWINNVKYISKKNSGIVPLKFGLGQYPRDVFRGKTKYSNFRIRQLNPQ